MELDVPRLRTSAPFCRQLISRLLSINAALFWAVAGAMNAMTVQATSLDQQRQLFRVVEQRLEAGDHASFERYKSKLKQYPLYPYLEFADFKGRIDTVTPDEMESFLARYGDDHIGVLMRKTWLAHLAQEKRWEDYQRFYVSRLNEQPEYYCRYLWSKHETGDARYAFLHIDTIWLNPESLPKVCDPLLSAWQQSGGLTDELLWKRFAIAMDAGNSALASSLALKMEKEDRRAAELMIKLRDQPRQISHTSAFNRRTQRGPDIVTFALKQLARNDADLAAELWRHYRTSLKFSHEQQSAIEVAVGRQYATRSDDVALAWLERATQDNPEPQLVEWQVRAALRAGRWDIVHAGISKLPGELFENNPMWQYWRARAVESLKLPITKPEDDPQYLFSQLAKQRNYYGFLAADRVHKRYAMVDTSHLVSDAALQRAVDARKALQRASEFIAQKDTLRARREWNYLLKYGDAEDRLAAAQVAYQWGWFREAIRATAKTDNTDNLALRFPVAFKQEFTRAARDVDLPTPWLLAITRQESAFAPDARSPVGASGLMQLMPRTAEQVAEQNGLGYSSEQLLNPAYNITLGSSYLDQLYERFENNRILATAAYNAGPGRVRQWLETMPAHSMAADVWIESIPYTETRNYVQNVLTYSAIYGYRLGNRQPILPSVQAGEPPKVLADIKG